MSIEEIKLATAFVLLLGTAGLSSWITHQVDGKAYVALELSIVQAKEKAVETALQEQMQLDEVKTQVALEDSQKQRRIATQTKEQLTNVQKYVKSGIVSWGTVQLFQSVLLGVSPSSVSIPTRATAESPSGFTIIDLAQNYVNNIGVCKANNQQLSSLIDYYNKAKVVQEHNKQ